MTDIDYFIDYCKKINAIFYIAFISLLLIILVNNTVIGDFLFIL